MVTPHCSLNSSQGVICEPYLLNETDAQGIPAMRCITICRDHKEILIQHIVTFDHPTLAQYINESFI